MLSIYLCKVTAFVLIVIQVGGSASIIWTFPIGVYQTLVNFVFASLHPYAQGIHLFVCFQPHGQANVGWLYIVHCLLYDNNQPSVER